MTLPQLPELMMLRVRPPRQRPLVRKPLQPGPTLPPPLHLLQHRNQLLELARLLVEEHPALIVVFMTGFSDRIRALQAAGVATLAKPFSREDLLSTLSKTAGLRWERGARG